MTYLLFWLILIITSIALMKAFEFLVVYLTKIIGGKDETN